VLLPGGLFFLRNREVAFSLNRQYEFLSINKTASTISAETVFVKGVFN
jgi:hypothetical protein